MRFAEYVENRDEENLRKMGLKPSRMRIIRKKPREYEDHEVLDADHFYVRIPENDNSELAKKLRSYNGQIVERTPNIYFGKGSRARGVWVSPLTGRHEEGNFVKVPFDWLKPVQSKKGKEHATWLGKTFFQRSSYVDPQQAKKNWQYNQEIYLGTEHEDEIVTYLGHLDRSGDRSMKALAQIIRREIDEQKPYSVEQLHHLADMLFDLGREKEAETIKGWITTSFADGLKA